MFFTSIRIRGWIRTIRWHHLTSSNRLQLILPKFPSGCNQTNVDVVVRLVCLVPAGCSSCFVPTCPKLAIPLWTARFVGQYFASEGREIPQTGFVAPATGVCLFCFRKVHHVQLERNVNKVTLFSYTYSIPSLITPEGLLNSPQSSLLLIVRTIYAVIFRRKTRKMPKQHLQSCLQFFFAISRWLSHLLHCHENVPKWT